VKTLAAMLALLALLMLAGAAWAEEPKPIAKADALEVEKWGLEVKLAQTQLEVLQRTLTNLQWEAQEVKRRLDAAAKARDETIDRLRAAAGLDKTDGWVPDVGALKWVKPEKK